MVHRRMVTQHQTTTIMRQHPYLFSIYCTVYTTFHHLSTVSAKNYKTPSQSVIFPKTHAVYLEEVARFPYCRTILHFLWLFRSSLQLHTPHKLYQQPAEAILITILTIKRTGIQQKIFKKIFASVECEY